MSNHGKACQSSELRPGRRPWPFWFLLGLPPFLCYAVMNIVRIIPPGPGWLWIGWLLVGIVPLFLALSAAMAVAQILGNTSIRLQVVLSCVQVLAVFVVWQPTFQLLVRSWR